MDPSSDADPARLLAQVGGDPTNLVGDLAASDRAAEQDRFPDELTWRLTYGRRRPREELADIVREVDGELVHRNSGA